MRNFEKISFKQFKKDYVVNQGDGIAQGVFMKYLLTDDDAKQLKKVRNDDDSYLKRR